MDIFALAERLPTSVAHDDNDTQDDDADGDDDDDGDCGGGGRREGWVTVMLMQFVPLPPTVHQEYTNVRVKMTNRMKYLMVGLN